MTPASHFIFVDIVVSMWYHLVNETRILWEVERMNEYTCPNCGGNHTEIEWLKVNPEFETIYQLKDNALVLCPSCYERIERSELELA